MRDYRTSDGSNLLNKVKENKELFTKLYNKLIECNVIYKEEIEEVINGLPQV